MDKTIEQKLARALGAEDISLLPYLPYLLQDLWSLGTPIKPILNIIKKNLSDFQNYQVLDLGCGKGKVGLTIAKETGATFYLVDALPEFIESAKSKAAEMNVTKYTFKVEDITQTVKTARDFDLVLFCSVGSVFGNAEMTVKTLKQTVKKGGYIIIEESYFANKAFVTKCSGDYETLGDWLQAFEKADVRLVDRYDEWGSEDEINFDYDNKHIKARADELCEKYPDKKELFQSYVQSQLNECEDLLKLQTSIWLLQTI